MIQMPEGDAKEGRESIIRILEWMSQCDTDKNISKEVLQYLGQQVAKATPEDIEVIMAWMFVGAISDRIMNRIAANEMVKEVAGMIAMCVTGDDDMMEA